MIQAKSKVLGNQRLKGNYWYAVFESPLIALKAKPGQFLNIKLSNGLKPFLRRPFSIHNVSGSKLEILYEVLGEGTKILSGKKRSEYLDIIGPLGTGFNYKIGKRVGSREIVVAGGIGVAPLYFLAQEIKSQNKMVLIGARTKDQVLCAKEFKALGCDIKIATDDGSLGFKGRVTDLLLKILSGKPHTKSPARIYACGPRPMLQVVADIAQKNDILAQVSMEEHMSCGIGACLGCVVKTKKGLERVCKEGPVFNARDLVW